MLLIALSTEREGEFPREDKLWVEHRDSPMSLRRKNMRNIIIITIFVFYVFLSSGSGLARDENYENKNDPLQGVYLSGEMTAAEAVVAAQNFVAMNSAISNIVAANGEVIGNDSGKSFCDCWMVSFNVALMAMRQIGLKIMK